MDSKGQAYICERRRVTGTFLESMELNDFPFDTQVSGCCDAAHLLRLIPYLHVPAIDQDLTVTVTSERGEHELELHEDRQEVSVINVEAFIDEQVRRCHGIFQSVRAGGMILLRQEWDLHTHIESRKKVTTNAYRNQKHKHPAVSLSCKASRRATYYMWNVIVVMVT